MVKTRKIKDIKKIEALAVPILKGNDVSRAGFFGSFVRGEATPKSDLDVLVEFRDGKTLFDLSHLELELENNLGRKVDVVTYNSLHPLLRDRIMKEEVRIL